MAASTRLSGCTPLPVARQSPAHRPPIGFARKGQFLFSAQRQFFARDGSCSAVFDGQLVRVVCHKDKWGIQLPLDRTRSHTNSPRALLRSIPFMLDARSESQRPRNRGSGVARGIRDIPCPRTRGPKSETGNCIYCKRPWGASAWSEFFRRKVRTTSHAAVLYTFSTNHASGLKITSCVAPETAISCSFVQALRPHQSQLHRPLQDAQKRDIQNCSSSASASIQQGLKSPDRHGQPTR